MGEELREANKKFKEFLNKIRKRKKFEDEIETFFYVFYLEGFKDGMMEGFKDGRNR